MKNAAAGFCRGGKHAILSALPSGDSGVVAAKRTAEAGRILQMRIISGGRLCAALLTTVSFAWAAGPCLAASQVPTPAHVIIVMEENHSYSEIIGNSEAPYINSLAQSGALFTQSYAVTHPSQPNYLDLFSGSDQGVDSDDCPYTFKHVVNEESQLIAKALTFRGYSEELPHRGSEVCDWNEYARKHVPWTNFTNDPKKYSLPFTSFPTDYSQLPTVSWVIPDLLDDMHDGTIQEGDTWLQTNMANYVTWAESNNSLMIVTWDEDDGTENNQIPTIFVGQMVKTGQYKEKITHFNVLRTIDAMYGLKPIGGAKGLQPITDVWQ
ncbi:MAG TPA: alkaline phosphatase family protein [Rhizomicrobium sp.]|nr:alkaline phosphatase family protein [Rhizomicrobium sp.]